MTTLGVGKNMVRSIRHWCLAAGVIEEVAGDSAGGGLRPTDLRHAAARRRRIRPLP